jgi:beta-phosphoglucomutase-like phosphatase (HAD superfamily)
VKKYILFDHDGVLVDTEFWYYKAGERALADIGLTLDQDQYLRDITWAWALGPKPGRQVLTNRPSAGSAKLAMITIRNILEQNPLKLKASLKLLRNCQNTSAWPS